MHIPAARALYRALYSNIPRPQRAMYFAVAANLNAGFMNPDWPPVDLWKVILETAANAKKTRELAKLLREDASLAAIHPLLDALLSDQIPICDRAPRKANEAPDFFAKDDTVTEPESLLFHDDLTLSTGRIPWLTGVLRKLSERVPAVCRLEVAVHGEAQSGTGFRFHEDWILTNWHVLFLDGKTPAAVTAEFGYEQDENENGLTPTVIACDAASIVSGKGDDWGVIRAKSAIPAAFAPIELSQSAPAFVQNPAFIIQHPNGARKRVAYTRNQITFADDRVVQYISDTQSGSSGAPVFDEKGRIIAVHHAGGRPQEVAGRAPMKKNEGIRIGRIEAALKQSGFGF